MAQGYQELDNNGNPVKKKFKIKIAGFTFGKTQIIIFCIFILILVLLSAKSAIEKKQEQEEAAEAAAAAAAAAAALSNNNSAEINLHDQIQAALTEQYGQAPDGFEWDYSGNLVTLSDDENATCEDVVYMYIRALSILDFATASKYASSSTVISSYTNYYDVVSNSLTDYYSDFLRKQYKESLTSLEIESISDTAVFADGTEYVTLTINALDLQDKDFWVEDKDELWETLRVYKETEEDSTKLEQTIYNYIYESYNDGSVGKRSYTIELIVSKASGGGWTISGDKELSDALQYENGVDVAQYISDAFSEWYQDIILKEQYEQIAQYNTSSTSTEDEESTESIEFDNESVEESTEESTEEPVEESTDSQSE